MKITKYIHSCLLVEEPDRVALFDPGVMSTPVLGIDTISQLDDIFITHIHQDHIDIDFVEALSKKFPNVRITSTNEVVELLKSRGITAQSNPPEGVSYFDSPHEDVRPLFDPPEEIGIHYRGMLSDPGDSHSFKETKDILALPMTAPWGYSIQALRIALDLKPKHVLPIHDWHWRDEAREQEYVRFEKILGEQGITFHKLKTGDTIEINI